MNNLSEEPNPWVLHMRARQDTMEVKLESVIRKIIEVQDFQTSFKKLEDDVEILKSNTTEVWHRLRTDEQRLDRMDANLCKFEEQLEETIEMIQNWFIQN